MEENEKQVAAMLQKYPNLQLVEQVMLYCQDLHIFIWAVEKRSIGIVV